MFAIKNQKQNNDSLNCVQGNVKQINQIIQQLKAKPEFSAELSNFSKIQQLAQQAENELQKVKNQSK